MTVIPFEKKRKEQNPKKLLWSIGVNAIYGIILFFVLMIFVKKPFDFFYLDSILAVILLLAASIGWRKLDPYQNTEFRRPIFFLTRLSGVIAFLVMDFIFTRH